MEEPQGSNASKTDSSPSLIATFPIMEDALERLKYLNYEKEFCLPRKRPLLDNLFFIYPSKNPSLQFQNLVEISGWLLDLITKEDDYLKVDKYDDPHTSANKLALALKSPPVDLNLDFPLSKIKQGYGEAVCKVLDALTRKAMEVHSMVWLRPNYPPEQEIEEDDGGDLDVGEDLIVEEGKDGRENEDDDEIDEEIGEEKTMKGNNEEKQEDDDGFFLDKKTTVNGNNNSSNNSNNNNNQVDERKRTEEQEGIDSNRAISKDNGGITRELWSEEVERVSSRLRTQHLFSSAPGANGGAVGLLSTSGGSNGNASSGGTASFSAEWRYHLDGAKKGVQTIHHLQSDVKARLSLLASDLQATVSRVEHREKSLTQEMTEELKEYAIHASKLKDLETNCTDINSKVMTLTTELTSINEKVEEQKEGMGEKGSTLSDTAPLLRLRSSLQQLKQEIQELDLKAGILDQKLISSRVKNSEKAAKEQLLRKKRGASAHTKGDFDGQGDSSHGRGFGSGGFNKYGQIALGTGGDYSDGAD